MEKDLYKCATRVICRVAYSTTEMKVFDEVNARANVLNGGGRLDRRRWLQSYMCHGDISMKFKRFRAKIAKQSSSPS